MADYKLGYAATAAPLVVKDKVIMGISGSDWPTRGFIDAYDAQTGKLAWRFYTVPARGEPGSETWPATDAIARGGGGVWVTGSYDPELNLLYYGVGNPNPDYYGEDRKGTNLYTASIIAIDADTGKLKWYFQFTPHDLHDWDSNHVPVLADVPMGGQVRKVVMVANRNGFSTCSIASPANAHRQAVQRYHVGARADQDGHPIVINDAAGCLPDQWAARTTCRRPTIPRSGTLRDGK
jgi:alcohol dehydrogenase (cytochrome c)